MRRVLVFVVAVLVPGLATAAIKGGNDLGDRGVISPFGSASLSYSKNDDASGQSGASLTSAILSPGVLYFVIDDLAVGGNVVLATRKPSAGDATTSIGIGPEVAYHLRFNDTWSLFPSLGLDLTRESLPGGSLPGISASTTLVTFAMSLYVPVLLRTGHFYMGFGPFLSRDLYAHGTSAGSGFGVVKNTSVGLSTTLGGWL